MKPLLSVGVITYNQEQYIEQCLDSILAQTTDFDFEIVIGEDWGTDQTRSICEQYALKYPHKIRLLSSPQNVGGVRNLLQVIDACEGSFVALLEGDDYWIDTAKLQKQVTKLQSDEQMTLCFTSRKNYEENTQIFVTVDENTEGVFSLIDFAKNTYFHTSTVVFRKPNDCFFLNKLANFKIGDRPLFIALLAESKGYAYKMRDICSVFRINYNSSFTPTKPFERNIIVAEMYAQLKELYPDLAVYFNHHLNVADYFILRESSKNKDKKEVKRLAFQILKRPTTAWDWSVKGKTMLHFLSI